MSLDLSLDCSFTGPALPEPFVKFNLEAELNKRSLLPKTTGADGRQLAEKWAPVRRKLGALVTHGGALRVQNHVIEPLLPLLGYARVDAADEMQTREGSESGGAVLVTEDGSSRLRVWCTELDADLDAPARRGEAYRFSHTRVAQRVLLTTGERLALLTNGSELRLLISDPARIDSQVAIAIDPHWKRSRDVPDSLRLLIALACPGGVRALPAIVDQARLQQAKVTKDLREQARNAIREFIQELIEYPENESALAAHPDKQALAKDLWHEGLITVYRLLFILKLESTDDPARSFSFASTSLWRNTFSPSVALAPVVRRVLDHGEQTGRVLQDGLRSLFRMLSDGLQCTELNVRPMAGALFAPATTPILGQLQWTETAIARLLDNLLWTRTGRGATSRERVHYGPLDVEDLGRVYEALLELEPGITTEPMCRLRRAKLEVVVPAAQGERYRPEDEPEKTSHDIGDEEADEAEEEEEIGRGKKTKVEWIEEISAGRFFLRVGLGRKATGSFYTPHSFVRFLVRETLGRLVQRVSPPENPQPCAILKLKVIDKAMGSGHFLVEACRFLAEALYDAARRCDELAARAEKRAEAYRAAATTNPAQGELATTESATAHDLRQRVLDLPDPDDELLRYLPSRSVEGSETGVSQRRAIALCRRMVAVHCLYGVDKNPLAVELAKLALWIECHAEGLPLTFLDHRLVVGDSLTGPFFENLLKYPGSQQSLDDLFTQGLKTKLTAALADALQHIRALEATVGITVADIERKQAAKTRLDRALAPFKILAAAWSGGVMLGTEGCDDTAYAALAKHIADNGNLQEDWSTALGNPVALTLLKMVVKGLGLPAISESVSAFSTLHADLNKNAIPALSFDLAFPEVFNPDGNATNRAGFDADLGNPPWDQVEVSEPEFWAQFNLEVLAAPTPAERLAVQEQLAGDTNNASAWKMFQTAQAGDVRVWSTLTSHQVALVGDKRTSGKPDAYRLCFERCYHILRDGGAIGQVLPSSFHAAEGATGIRELCLNKMKLKCCFSFENRRKLFEIDGRQKFAAVVAHRDAAGSDEFLTAFYLWEDSWLFAELRQPAPLVYQREAIIAGGGGYHVFPECRSQYDFDVLAVASLHSVPLGELVEGLKVDLRQGMSVTREAWRRVPLTARHNPAVSYVSQHDGEIAFPVHEGKTFTDYADSFESPIREVVPRSKLSVSAHWLTSVRHFRLAQRLIASATNQRTSIFAILPPGCVCVHSARVEAKPNERPSSTALWLCSVWNSFAFDFLSRTRVGSNVSEFIVNLIPMKVTEIVMPFLSHCALRLTCNHAGYAPLRREQLGEAWREMAAAFTGPMLSGDDARWAVRAAVDAVVAHTYGLTRDQYAHVLSTFSHSSYPDAPRQCLAAFDELQSLGLEAFTKKHDPYWEIPLNENLPQPVIDLPIPEPGVLREEAPAYRTDELFGFTTQAAPNGSGALFTEQPVTPKRRKGRK
jgi:hypothetical protein